MVAVRGFVTVFYCRLLLLDQMLFKLLEWLDLFTECVDEWLQLEWIFHPISIQKFRAFSTRQLLSTTFDGVNENLFWFHERPVPGHIVFQNLPFQQIVCFFAEMVRLYLGQVVDVQIISLGNPVRQTVISHDEFLSL